MSRSKPTVKLTYFRVGAADARGTRQRHLRPEGDRNVTTRVISATDSARFVPAEPEKSPLRWRRMTYDRSLPVAPAGPASVPGRATGSVVDGRDGAHGDNGRDHGHRRSDPTRLDRTARRTAGALLVLLLLVVALIVFWPGPPDPGGQSALASYLRHPERHGLPRWVTFDLVQNLANVAMFVPLGLLGSLALRRHNYLVVVYAAAASGLIEFVQLVLLPHRVSSLQDVLANTVGASLGLLLAVPALLRRRRRRRLYALGRRRAVDSPRRAARAARL